LLRILGTYAAWALGAVLGIYCGAVVLIPAAGVFLFILIAKRMPMACLNPFIVALSVQMALGFSMLVAGIFESGGMRLVLFDLLVLAIGLIWLMACPGLIPVLLLGSYQLLAVVMNMDQISGYQIGGEFHKTITMTIALRLAAIIALTVEYRQFKKNKKETEKAKLDKGSLSN
jgi:hypothetical protein